MATQFRENDMLAHLHQQEEWSQSFVDEHAHEQHGYRGQRKLLCSNLLGITQVAARMQDHGDTRKLVLVVAGASPGVHMPVLLKQLRKSSMAGRFEIHMYDPQALESSLHAEVQKDDSLSFEKSPFTQSDAEHWRALDRRKHCLLFFSDIRSKINERHHHTGKDEGMIEHDMRLQEQWVQAMQPDYCMLKFHAPHATRDQQQVAKSFPYLFGRLYKQPYIDPFSAECRLFCTREDIRKQKQYSTLKIERHFFFHTKHIRLQTFSVGRGNKQLRYDEAFEWYVAHKARRFSASMRRSCCATLARRCTWSRCTSRGRKRRAHAYTLSRGACSSFCDKLCRVHIKAKHATFPFVDSYRCYTACPCRC